MTDPDSHDAPPPARSVVPSLSLVGAGVALVLLYYLLAALGVGNVGQPTDIGGGLLALVGYLFVVVGLIWTVVAFRRRRN